MIKSLYVAQFLSKTLIDCISHILIYTHMHDTNYY